MNAQNANRLIWLILLLSGSLYAQVATFGFLNWDDDVLLTKNPFVQASHFQDLERVWDPAPALNKKVLEYFPLRDSVYALLHLGWGLKPWVYHVFNLLLYLLHIWLVFWIARYFLQHVWGALIAASLFALHPLHVEVVAWVSGLKELMMSSFVMLGFVLFLMFVERQKEEEKQKKTRFLGVSVLFCVIAASLSKHLGVISVVFYGWFFLLFGIDKNEKIVFFQFSQLRRLFLASWPVWVGALFALWYGLFSLEVGRGNLGVHEVLSSSSGQEYGSLLLQPLVQLQNVQRLFVPWHLQPVYDPPVGVFGLLWWFSLFVCLLVAGVSLWAWKKGHKIAVFFAGWVVIGILPFVVFRVSNQFTADRYLYLSTVGFCILLAQGILWLAKHRAHGKRIAFSIFVMLCLFYSSSLLHTLPMWKDSASFWQEFIKRAPDQTHALGGLAQFQMSQGKFKQSIHTFRRFLQKHPQKMPPRLEADMCIVLLLANEPQSAVKCVRGLLKKRPRSAFALNAAGYIMFRGGQGQQALGLLRAAIARRPQLYAAHIHYVQVLLALKQRKRAMLYVRSLLRKGVPNTTRRMLGQLLRKRR